MIKLVSHFENPTIYLNVQAEILIPPFPSLSIFKSLTLCQLYVHLHCCHHSPPLLHSTQQPEDFENVHQIVMPLLVKSLQSLSTLLRMRSNFLLWPTGPCEGLVLACPSHILCRLLTSASHSGLLSVPRMYQALSHFRVSAWDTCPLSFFNMALFSPYLSSSSLKHHIFKGAFPKDRN